MDRSTIYFLHQKGWSNIQIAEFVGHHRDTIARVLREPVDQEPAARPRTSAIAVFADQIEQWLDQRLPVQRMLELARADPDHPYRGGDAAFYDYVRPRKRARKGLPATVTVRFEGLPGELLQIDWGEVRQFPFTQPAVTGQTRYFFAARLKYSRWMWVRFTTNMQEETLLRCLIACFAALDGVPWVVTTDNMKTITLGRDSANQPIWHPAYLRLATEFGFHPAVCAPAAGNQKGAVENLVKFVKANFLAGRSFYDDVDLADECTSWLRHVNEERPSDATECCPSLLLRDEQPRFSPLPSVAADYGFFDTVTVTRESVVILHTNRYSVPVRLVGLALTARLHPRHIDLYHGSELVASHPRCYARNQRIVTPEHYEAVFVHKPRARVMVYRDWLIGLAPSAARYVSEVCRRRYTEMEPQILALYQLAQQVGIAVWLEAVDMALVHETFGVEYLQALTERPRPVPTPPAPLLAMAEFLQPPQPVERDLEFYEQFVANRGLQPAGEGGQ